MLYESNKSLVLTQKGHISVPIILTSLGGFNVNLYKGWYYKDLESKEKALFIYLFCWFFKNKNFIYLITLLNY